MLFALDANAVIHAFKRKGGLADRIAATPPGSIVIPAVAVYEVERGVAASQNSARRRQQFNDLLAIAAVLPFDAHAAQVSARVMADLERRGCKIGPIDTLIAGTALAHGATLVTHNTREFERVPGLMLEDWF